MNRDSRGPTVPVQGSDRFVANLHLEVSQASHSAIAAVEARGSRR